MTGNLFIVAAASGAGKTSLVRALLDNDPRVRKSVSCSTRAPRAGEVNGQHYNFVSQQKFSEMLKRGEFLEHAEVHGNYYGTSKNWVEDAMKGGGDILLEIDWQGAQQVRRIFPQAVGIFILPPSLAVLEERLRARGQDSMDVIASRLKAAREEMSHVQEFDYVIINEEFGQSVQELICIVHAQRLKLKAQLERNHDLINRLK
ncbi:MAG TPA: guanylate kinase [Burkholderiales bacterium]|nr:guanylate kinase [Burkholderiales bacterium]